MLHFSIPCRNLASKYSLCGAPSKFCVDQIILISIPLFVVGEDSTTIQGFLDKSVCLPCNCSERIHDGEFRWQIKGTNDLLLKYNGTYHVGENYKKRVSLISPDESSNCSLLLNNIAAEDQGTYVCSYFNPGYITFSVELQVSGGSLLCTPKVIDHFFVHQFYNTQVAQSCTISPLNFLPTAKPPNINKLHRNDFYIMIIFFIVLVNNNCAFKNSNILLSLIIR